MRSVNFERFIKVGETKASSKSGKLQALLKTVSALIASNLCLNARFRQGGREAYLPHTTVKLRAPQKVNLKSKRVKRIQDERVFSCSA